jgi:hypothetical protein
MKWIRKHMTLPVAVTLATLLAGAIATTAVLGVHAEDTKQHLTREVLQREYVPRTELDHRMEDMQTEQKQIREGVIRIETFLLENQ